MKGILLIKRNINLILWLILLFCFNIIESHSQIPSGFYYNQEFLVDFGELENSSGNWNNVSALNTSYNLINSSGTNSSFSIEITNGIKGQNEVNDDGITINFGALADASLTSELGNLAENSATKDYFYHTSSGQITVNFLGLDINKKYQIMIFATRVSTSERITQYTLNGNSIVNAELQTSGAGIGVTDHINGNVGLVSLGSIKPDSDGNLVLNATSSTLCYLGALRLVEYSPNTPDNSFLIDFGNTEISSPDGYGNYWNNKNYSSQPLNDFVNTNGATSEYSMTVTSGWGLSSSGGVSDASTTLYTELLSENDATNDYAFVSGGSGLSPNDFTVLISGLPSTNAYRFKVFSSRNISVDQTNQFNFEGENNTDLEIMSSSSSDGPNLNAFYSEYIQPNSSGEILITVSSSDINGQIIFNALEIDEFEYSYATKEFLIDFGNLETTTSPDVNGSYWSNIENKNIPITLNTIDNTLSEYTLELTNGGFGSNGGLTDPLLSEGISSLAIATATTDYCYAKEGLSDSINITFRNLDLTKGYRFNCFATRKDINQERITNYEFIGSNTVEGQLQTTGSSLGTTGHQYGNLNLFSSDLVFPNNKGEITIKAKRETGTEFCYLGALRIEEFDENPGVENLMYIPEDDSYTFFSLPVSLISFRAYYNNENVILKWSTATEVNNDYFIIEHSSDGIVWSAINTIDGFGNSDTRIDYETIDNTPSKGLNYYRLIQIDFDGSRTYFDAQEVFVNSSNHLPITQIYPNPVQKGNEIHIAISSLRKGSVTIEIINTTGKIEEQKTLQIDHSFFTTTLSSLKSGIYYLRVQQNKIVVVQKVIIK